MQTNRKKRRGRRRRGKIKPSLIAIALVAAMAVSTLAYAAAGGNPLETIASLFGIESRAAGDGTWLADSSTQDSWYGGTQGVHDSDSTETTGRIWTDKSVFSGDAELKSISGDQTLTVENDDGTALVGLSALSSAARITGKQLVSQPLDIVMVLDVSGSMSQTLSETTTTTYTEVYNVNTRRAYYIQNADGTYTEVDYHNSIFGREYWYNTETDEEVEPRTGRNDNNPSHVQFYQRNTQTATVSKIEGLQSAVNSFIDQTAAMNDTISDPNMQHRISLVKFAGNSSDSIGNSTYRDGDDRYNYSQVVTDLAAYNSQTKGQLQNTVNALDPAGATQADYGFNHAERVLNGEGSLTGARQNAKKIVIFFTDGNPTTWSNWDGSVAADAINTSHDLKAANTTVYSIGVFDGANPSDTNGNFNRYMNAVSSNYPDAECTNWRGNQTNDFGELTLGDRAAADSQYYFAADDADSLNEVFDKIYQDVGSNPQSPIESSDVIGGENVGYLTFTDTLGEYTEVKDFKSVVFAGQQFTQKSSSTEGNVTTYTFSGTVEGNDVYGSANLNDLIIRVTHAGQNNLQTGDVVEVQIPTTLLPLRLYTADTDEEGNTTTDVKDAYPIRVFYTVGLKDEVMSNGTVDASKIDSSYIASHTDDDGNLYFTSNQYASGDNGTTTASFTPAQTNSFYFFTQDTPIYTNNDPDNLTQAERIDENGTYYIPRTYYENNNEVTVFDEVSGSALLDDQHRSYIGNNENGYFVRSGAPRFNRANDFSAAKEGNETATATNAIRPRWDGASSVTVNLGNNGKISYALAGSLEIRKTVDWGNGTPNADKEFTFTVNFNGNSTLEGQFAYSVYEGDSTTPVDGAGGTIQDGGTIRLKNGQRAVIENLPAGTTYAVTESAEEGFTTTQTGENGTIAANETAAAAFTNTYSVSPVTLEEGSISGTKQLNGRDWMEDESFTFRLWAAQPTTDAPLPDNAQEAGGYRYAETVVENSNYADGQEVGFGFGEIEYSAPGTYYYVVSERAGSAAGLTYSQARYIVTVTVEDNGDGTLKTPTVSMVQSYTENGTVIEEGDRQAADTAAFVNTFTGADEDTVRIEGTKDYTDHTGSNPWDTVGMFQFTITADEGNPEGGPVLNGDPVSAGLNGSFNSENLTFDIHDVGKTFTYYVSEVLPEGVDADNPTKDGMTYDTHTETVTITVSQDESGSVVATVTYDESGCVFANSYEAEASAGVKPEVTKAVTGHDAEEGQFGFTLAPTDDSTAAAVASGAVTGFADGETTMTADAPAISKGDTADIAFSEMTFTKPGTYTFNVQENMPGEGVTVQNGWTYDTHTYTITYTVEDQNGILLVTDTRTTGEKTFTNRYQAETTYGAEVGGGLNVTKVLNGYVMSPNQFTFTITPTGDTPELTVDTDKQFSNPIGAASGVQVTMSNKLGTLRFTQDDAGKTFTYEVKETVPDPVPAGYTYDDETAYVEIEIVDNGDGTLDTVTTITKGEYTQTVDSGEADQEKPTIPFVNDYKAGAAVLEKVDLQKTVTGRDWNDTDSFTFELKALDGAPSPTGGTQAVVKRSNTDSDGEADTADDQLAGFSFGEFRFNTIGEYVYHVTEVNGGTTENGVTYDDRTAVITITVSDNGSGTLQTAVSITGLTYMEGVPTFVNEYEAGDKTYDAEGGLNITKTLLGRDMDEGEFSAVISGTKTDLSRAGLSEETGDDTASVTRGFGAASEGNAAVITPLNEITFTADDVKNNTRLKYTITEVQPDADEDDTLEGTQSNGVTYDQASYEVEIWATDNLDGTLKIHTSIDGAEVNQGVPTIGFENVYAPIPVTYDGGADALLGGHKYIDDSTGSYQLADGQFTFIMRAQNAGNPMPVGDGVTTGEQGGLPHAWVRNSQTDPNANSAVYDFGSITFDGDDMEGARVNEDGTLTKTFTYNVFEWTATTLPGISYDDTTYSVTFTVTEDQSTGEMSVEVSAVVLSEGSDENVPVDDINKLDFTNVYDAGSITGGQRILKQLQGRDFRQGDTFTFDVSMTAENEGGTPMDYDDIPKPDGTQSGAVLSEVTLNDTGDGYSYTVTINPSATASGNTYQFGTGRFTYTHTGTYTYLVSEQTSTVDKVTSDDKTYEVVVTIALDQGTNALTRSVTINGEPVTEDQGVGRLDFVNTYTPDGVTLSGDTALKAQKTLTGRSWKADDSFEFVLTAVTPGAPMPSGQGTEAVITGQTGADGTSVETAFGDLTFTKADLGNAMERSFVYEIRETKGDIGGITYDEHAATVTVTVTDNVETGKLEAAVTYDNVGAPSETDAENTAIAAFTNIYDTGDTTLSGSANLKVTKALDGRDWQEGDTFTFELTGGDLATKQAIQEELIEMPAADAVTIAYDADDPDAAREAAFGDIVFKEPGNFVFHIAEVIPANATNANVPGKTYAEATDQEKASAGWTLGGVTYDNQPREVKVSVVDNTDGTLTASVIENSGNPTFTNTYEPGGDVTVGAGEFELTKDLSGKSWDGDEFTFEITGLDDAANYMPEDTRVTVNGPDEEGGSTATFGFGPITYDKEGEFVYEVREIVDEDSGSYNPGITYSQNVAKVTVKVTDNLHGGYTAAATVVNETFTNTYQSELNYDAKGGLAIVKEMEGHDIAADQFEFTVTPADQASAEKMGLENTTPVVLSTVNGATMVDGVSTYEIPLFTGKDQTGVIFTQEDEGKTYTYTIVESKGGDTSIGYTNDDTEYTVAITTEDDGKGLITVTTTVTDNKGSEPVVYTYTNTGETAEEAVVTFHNSYSVSGELGGNGDVSIEAVKELTNRDLVDGEFVFHVTDLNGAVVATGTNNAEGKVTFEAIKYDTARLQADAKSGAAIASEVDGKDVYTYQYTVAEDEESFDDGVSVIAGSFGITVTVTDNNDGTLSIDVTYPDNGDGLVFRNTYGDSAKDVLHVAGAKKLAVASGDNAPDITGKYTFELTGSEGAPMPDKTTANNDDAGNVIFGDITYTMENVFGAAENADLTAETADAEAAGDISGEAEIDTYSTPREKTFTYTITESGSVTGVSNDEETEKSFTVTVTDNGDGTLSAVCSETEGAQFVFTNTYSVTPTEPTSPTDSAVTITKELAGRDMKEGEFEFVMLDGNGETAAEGSNAADGTVTLSGVQFDEPGIYNYQIKEKAGNLGGITYDPAIYTASATVKDNGDGTLSVEWTVKDADGNVAKDIVFHNEYSYSGTTSVTLSAAKALDGRELKAEEFTFLLKDSDGEVVASAKNDAAGAVQFKTLTFDTPGTYEYTISEEKGDAANVTYDDTVYNVTITVTDSGEGYLTAAVDYDGKILVFTNYYKEPVKTDDTADDGGNTPKEEKAVQTGDASAIIPAAVLMAAAALIIVTVLVMTYRRRRR